MKIPPSPPAWMKSAAATAAAAFSRRGVHVTMGGEPTFVTENPTGPEWNYAAVGPEKLPRAMAFADALIAEFLHGGTAFFTPGKQYPGEINPRWALRILYRKGEPPPPDRRKLSPRELPSLPTLGQRLLRQIRLPGKWERFTDPLHPENEVRALLLDHDGTRWQTHPWQLPPRALRLTSAEGPAGLRLPLAHLPPEIPRRALVFERRGKALHIFFPPLLAAPFLALLDFFHTQLPPNPRAGIEESLEIHYQGYLPPDLPEPWQVLGLASDPGVLEVNLPPCNTWEEYYDWMHVLEHCAKSAGLRSWRNDRSEFSGGTGGGNHLLFGSPANKPNGFYEHPGWLASIITFWQRHPALSYLFTGEYVGASSQAPRPDESGISLRELELALTDLRDPHNPPIPYFIAENLRHLLVDSAGNPHRAEISLDKFHDPNHPAGLLGLIEFRAIETMPHAQWSAAVALLWQCLLAMLLAHPEKRPLRHLGRTLHDKFFLPHFLWEDLSSVLGELHRNGFELEPTIYREIWNWKFPELLHWKEGDEALEIRKAHESWPLLAETPDVGGTTSRFVDTSLRRLEFCAPSGFSRRWELRINGRTLALQPFTGPAEGEVELAGLRYRHAALYPSLHPRRPVQLPLYLEIAKADTGEVIARFVLEEGAARFHKVRKVPASRNAGDSTPIAPSFPGAFTCDLRF